MLKSMILPLSISLYTRIKDLGTFGITKGVKLVLSAYPARTIALANASKQNDGYGAQIQRILSIKALADSLNVEFKLNLLSQVERQISQKHLQEVEQGFEIANFNDFLVSLLVIPSKENITMESQHYAKNLHLLFLILLRNLLPALFRKKASVVSLENAYKFVQYDSDLYTKLKFNVEAIEQENVGKRIVVKVHLRFVNFTFNTDRYLDVDYYFKNLDYITDMLGNLGTPYEIHLHSDFERILPASNLLGISESTLKYLSEIGVTEQGGAVNLDTLQRANDFKTQLKGNYSNVIEFEDDDALASLKAMANSSFLILSKSSFAFVAGILNKNGHVTSPHYWNQPLSNWNDKSVVFDK